MRERGRAGRQIRGGTGEGMEKRKEGGKTLSYLKATHPGNRSRLIVTEHKVASCSIWWSRPALGYCKGALKSALPLSVDLTLLKCPAMAQTHPPLATSGALC